MKNLKLLAASIVAGSLLTSSSQANKIEGTFVGVGLGNLGVHSGYLQTTTLDTFSLSYKVVVGYAFNFYNVVLLPEFTYTYSGTKCKDDEDEKIRLFEPIYFGLNSNQFLGKFNVGYDFGGFGIFVNLGFAAHSPIKARKLAKGKEMLNSFGFSWGFKGVYDVAKNIALGAGIDFNSFSLTKDVKDLPSDPRKPKSKTYGKLRNNKFDFVNTYVILSYNF